MSLLLIQAMQTQASSSVYSARSAVGVDGFDTLIQAMNEQSRKERDEFDEFIAILKSPSEEYAIFLIILATPIGMSSRTMLRSASVEEEMEVIAFANFVKGGPLPPRSIKKMASSLSTTSRRLFIGRL